MAKRFIRQNGESMPAFQARIAAIQRSESMERCAMVFRHGRPQGKRYSADRRNADRIDGFDRDDIGESHD